MRTAPYDGRTIANFILDLADSQNRDLTQMQVLKILYFAHGWFLSRFKEPLIFQSFEAWEYGPVIRVVRDALKQYGKGPVKGRAEAFDMATGECFPMREEIDPDHQKFISDIYFAYSGQSAWDLSEMTHESGSPWDNIWNSKQPIGKLSLRIDNKSIQRHFERLPQDLKILH